MSWLYSRVLVEESLGGSCLDGEQCALWNGTHTQRASWLPDRTTDACRLSQSGMTYKLLTDDLGEAVLTWCLEDSLAKTFHGHGQATVSRGNDQVYGSRCTGSLQNAVRDTHSLKTSGISGLEDLPLFSICCTSLDTKPQTGISTLPTAAAHTYESGHSFSRTGSGRRWCSQVTASSAKCVESQSVRIAESIIRNAIAQDHIQKTNGAWLKKIGELLPTPTCQDAKNNAGVAQYDRNTWPLNVIAGGSLNPEWVEWLMGWPLGWTDLRPLETDKFRQWLRSHGRC